MCVIVLSVDCEWSDWYVYQECNESCDGGTSIFEREKILTKGLISLGYTTCKGNGRERKNETCKGTH